MKVVDYYLIREFIKYILLAVLCVVAIYLLIDLFEQLDYFSSHHASLFMVGLYYLYSLPAAVSLLLPVSIILSCFFVYGVLARERGLFVFQSAGIKIYRLFAPVVVIGIILTIFQFFGYEFITIPATKKLEDLQRIKIEHKHADIATKQYNLFVKGKEQVVYFIKEYEISLNISGEKSGVMRDFIIAQYSTDGKILKRIDGDIAFYQNNRWLAKNVSERTFVSDSIETYTKYDSLILSIKEKPDDFNSEARVIEELSVWELNNYIRQLKIAGVKTAKAEVEFNCRFANSFIGLILILLSLPLAVTLRRGGVMFGLGLGLLFSFIYWGLIQIFKAYGQVMILSPFLAGWLANFIFLVVVFYFLITAKQ